MIFTIDATDKEMFEQHQEYLNASTRDKIAEALIDENGMRPTDAALDVIMMVVESTDRTDEYYGRWESQPDGPVPSLRRYASEAGAVLSQIARQAAR